MYVIENLEQRLPEIGRIRVGDVKGTGFGGRGKPLENFRITVPFEEREIIDMIASLYGIKPGGEAGDVLPWFPNGKKDGDSDEHPPFWATYLTCDKLPVALPPIAATYSSGYEQWKAGYCVRRCNGVDATWYEQEPITAETKRDRQNKPIKTYKKVAGKCQCDFEDPHPDPKTTCMPVARLNVMIVGLPASGVFRLETHSRTFMREAPAMVSLAEHVFASTGRPVRANLYLVKRQTRSLMNGEQHFIVPILRIYEALTMEALRAPAEAPAIASGERPHLQLVSGAQAPEGSPPEEAPQPDELPPGYDDDIELGEYREVDYDAKPPSQEENPDAWREWVLSMTFGELRALATNGDRGPMLYVANALSKLTYGPGKKPVVGQGAIQLALEMDPVEPIEHLVSGEVIQWITEHQQDHQQAPAASQPAML